MIQIIQKLSREAFAAATIIGCLIFLSAFWYQRKKRNGVATKWVSIGRVKNLYIYPLKSGRRKELKTAICTEYGLVIPKSETSDVYQFRDRNLVIYKADTKETYHHSKIHLIETVAWDADHFILNTPNMLPIKVKFPNLSENKTDETILYTTERIYMIDCGDEVAKWLSQYILEKESGLRMGFHDGSRRRNINEAFKKYFKYYYNLKNEATGMFSNLSSYLIVNQASVEDLNIKIDNNVTANNFRPNILVEGATPYAEDNWEWIKIGNVILYYVKPCTRCYITTLDPETAKRAQNHEPLKTLKTYRLLKDVKKIDLDGNRAIMGVNMGLLNEGGLVSIGDTVYVGKY